MMVKRVLKLLGPLLLWACVASTVYAKPLYIEITGGQNYGIPIAILPFAGNTDAMSSRPLADMAQVISQDLASSGQFQLIPLSDVKSYPRTQREIRYSFWQGLGAEKMVLGNIQSQANGRYTIEFQLYDLFKDSDLPLAHVRFSDKTPHELRALAHHVSDVIFEKLIGVRGFFSTRIAYITVDRYRDETVHTLTVADADGRNDRALLTARYPLMSPKWSPDGRHIAFVSFEDNRSAVKIIDLYTGKLQLISRIPGINGAPAWSPDGQQLAMVLSKDGSPKLYLYHLKNRKFTRITHGGAIDTEPHWARDGQSIYFTSNRGGKPQIYQVTLSTGKVRRVTFEGNYNATPSLTPDGKQLVMMHRDETGTFNIAVQNLQTGKVKVLTKARQDESPTIAPNGMMVLFGTEDGDRTALGAVSLDGRFHMRLPVQDGHVKEPAWSPFLS